MRIREHYRGRLVDIVTVAEVPDGTTDDEVQSFALETISESADRFYDVEVRRFSMTPTVVSVYLHKS